MEKVKDQWAWVLFVALLAILVVSYYILGIPHQA